MSEAASPATAAAAAAPSAALAALGSGCSPRMSRSQYSRAVLPALEPSFGRFFADRLLSIQMSSGTFSTSAAALCQACQVALFLVCAPVSQRGFLSHRERSLTDRERDTSLTQRVLSVREESLSVMGEISLCERRILQSVRERNLSLIEKISLCEK
jgi:hypothetical protein